MQIIHVIITMNAYICVMIASFVSTFFGLDLRKWHSWLFGAYVFVSIAFGDYISPKGSIGSSLQIGAILAFFMMFIGVLPIMHWGGREDFKNWLRERFKKKK